MSPPCSLVSMFPPPQQVLIKPPLLLVLMLPPLALVSMVVVPILSVPVPPLIVMPLMEVAVAAPSTGVTSVGVLVIATLSVPLITYCPISPALLYSTLPVAPPAIAVSSRMRDVRNGPATSPDVNPECILYLVGAANNPQQLRLPTAPCLPLCLLQVPHRVSCLLQAGSSVARFGQSANQLAMLF